jgi:magnesium-transporting ATPase (P-type)
VHIPPLCLTPLPSRTARRIALVLIAVVCLTCFLSYYQEGQSAKVMDSFKVTHPPIHPSIHQTANPPTDPPPRPPQPSSSPSLPQTTQDMMSEKARVRRGGKEVDVPSEDLVVGDLVMIESGVRIPADLRIIQSDSLKVYRKRRRGTKGGICVRVAMPCCCLANQPINQSTD